MRLYDQIHKLDYYRHVIEAGSIQGGAKRASIGQPQMSKTIKQLESSLRTKLILRTRAGVIPTPEGDMLYRYSLSVLQHTEKLELAIKTNKINLHGQIRIGTYDSIGRYFFPNFLKYFEIGQDQFNVLLKTSRSEIIAREISEGKIDLGIIVNEHHFSGLQYETIYQDSFGLYSSLTLDTQFQRKLIYFEGPEELLNSSMKPLKMAKSICCDNIETVKLLTEQSLGIGLLPHRVARDGVLRGRLRPFSYSKIKDNNFATHQINICYRKDESKALVHFVKSELERYVKTWSAS